MKQEQASLGSNKHFDLIGDLEPGAAFEDLLGQEDMNETFQLALIGLGKAAKEWEPSGKRFTPGSRKRLGTQRLPLATFAAKQAEHGLRRIVGYHESDVHTVRHVFRGLHRALLTNCILPAAQGSSVGRVYTLNI